MIQEKQKEEFRKLVPPFIKSNLTTGFNICKQSDFIKLPDASFQLQYFHGNVRKDHPHYGEVTDLIKQCEYKVVPISILRLAYYSSQRSWPRSKQGNFLDLNGKVIDEKTFTGKKLVKEDEEFILTIGFDKASEVQSFMRQAHNKLYLHKVHPETGTYVGKRRIINKCASLYAYEIPFLSLKANQNVILKSFRPVLCMSAVTKDCQFIVQSLIKNQNREKVASLGLLPNLKSIKLDKKPHFINQLAHNEYL